MIDTTAIKQAAAGRWLEILVSLGGCPVELLDGKHHPCPRCGGQDRFRLIDLDAGAVYCNACFSERNGDGLAALGWLRGWGFKRTAAELARYLGRHENGREPAPGSAAPRPKKPPQTYRAAHAAIAALVQRHGKPSATWTYHNAKREPVGVVVRWDSPAGKKIMPISPDGQGGWTISGMATPRPLYRLPELAAAEVVFVLEGEKAADAAKSIGLMATSSPHGSKSAKHADWSVLAGKRVVIVPDHDADGEHYASEVAKIVAALKPPTTVKIVRLPGLPAAGDIVDWIDAHGNAVELEELRRQIEALADGAEAGEPIQPKVSAPTILSWRPFPVEVLPEPMRGFVTAGAKAIGCDPVMIGLPMLVALASAIGATRRIRLKATLG